MIDIRFIETTAECHAVEELQRQVWQGDDLEVVPLHMLITVAHNGGVLLGAWDGDKLVGFVFGFLGADEGEAHRPAITAMTRLKHCSHMMGILPDYRDKGIGYKLKLAQRNVVLKQGVRLIIWTYDPLESRNANLNIARLGAVCKTYKRELYGQMADVLNVGLPSDRFQVDWWITSQRVKQRLSGDRARLTYLSFASAGTPIVNPTRPNSDGLPVMIENITEPLGTLGLVEIPANFQAVKSADTGLAREWKARVRSIFESAFETGYIVTDFIYEIIDGRQRAFYVLAQGDARLSGEG